MKTISREKIITGFCDGIVIYRYLEIFETASGCRHCRLAGYRTDCLQDSPASQHSERPLTVVRG